MTRLRVGGRRTGRPAVDAVLGRTARCAPLLWLPHATLARMILWRMALESYNKRRNPRRSASVIFPLWRSRGTSSMATSWVMTMCGTASQQKMGINPPPLRTGSRCTIGLWSRCTFRIRCRCPLTLCLMPIPRRTGSDTVAAGSGRHGSWDLCSDSPTRFMRRRLMLKMRRPCRRHVKTDPVTAVEN